MSLMGNIKTLCKQHKTSIPKLERATGIGRGSIYKWEKSSPTIERLQKVAEYFNVSIEFLLFGTENADREPFNKQSVLKLAKDNCVSIGQVITVLDEVKTAILDEMTV
ncbi:hypothetical protein JCM15765_04470 [Paradesulfitobacterium aromaticivorans]